MPSSNLFDSIGISKCVFVDSKIPILQTNLHTISQYMHQLKYMGSYELIKYRYYTLREKGWDAHKFFGFTDKKS